MQKGQKNICENQMGSRQLLENVIKKAVLSFLMSIAQSRTVF